MIFLLAALMTSPTPTPTIKQRCAVEAKRTMEQFDAFLEKMPFSKYQKEMKELERECTKKGKKYPFMFQEDEKPIL